MRALDDTRFRALLETRAERPGEVAQAARSRLRRPLLVGDKRLMIIAVDHPARGVVGVGDRPMAMADRHQLLESAIRALHRPGVDGVLGTPDILDDLLLLGELDERVCIGSMNRGGLLGATWELDDRFTAHDAASIERMGFEGGKMLVRIKDDDPGTVRTLEACARAVTELASRELIALVEPLPVDLQPGGSLSVSDDPDRLAKAIGIASGLGATSAYTWLKLPAPSDPERMMAATTMPALLLGGDPGSDRDRVLAAWERALRIPNVRGLVAGRSLLFPPDGDVERATDTAVELVHGSAA